jgi:hypothetical protein
MDVLVGRKNGTVSVGNECGTVPAKENEAKQG